MGALGALGHSWPCGHQNAPGPSQPKRRAGEGKAEVAPCQTEVTVDTWHCTPRGTWVATLAVLLHVPQSPGAALRAAYNNPPLPVMCVFRRLHSQGCLTFLCCRSCLVLTNCPCLAHGQAPPWCLRLTSGAGLALWEENQTLAVGCSLPEGVVGFPAEAGLGWTGMWLMCSQGGGSHSCSARTLTWACITARRGGKQR